MFSSQQAQDATGNGPASRKASMIGANQACMSVTRRVMPHKVIFSEGEDNKGVYEIISGKIMLYKTMQDGRRQITEMYSQGDVIGNLSSKTYLSTAETLTTCEVQCLPKDLVNVSQLLQQKILQRYESQLERASQHILLLGRKTALEKVASFLLRLITKKSEDPETVMCWRLSCGQGPHTLHLPMTRQEVADHLGLTIETVSRSLSDLKRRGAIEVRGHDGITILKACMLCNLDGTSRHALQ